MLNFTEDSPADINSRSRLKPAFYEKPDFIKSPHDTAKDDTNVTTEKTEDELDQNWYSGDVLALASSYVSSQSKQHAQDFINS